jgi:hypothetical protein
MARTTAGKGPFGLRITPDDIRKCFSFLRRAAALVSRGFPGVELGPHPGRWTSLKDARRLPSRRSAENRRRP